MKLIRYLIPLWIGVFVYTVFSMCFGAKGISAFIQLEAERNREMANIEVLRGINEELKAARNGLSADKRNFTVYARELGFAAPEEHFIRIVGLGNLSKKLISPGEVLMPRDPDYTPDRVVRIFSFFAALTVLVSMGAYDFLKFLKDR